MKGERSMSVRSVSRLKLEVEVPSLAEVQDRKRKGGKFGSTLLPMLIFPAVDEASLDSDDLDDEEFAPKPSARKKAASSKTTTPKASTSKAKAPKASTSKAGTSKAGTSKASSKASTPAKKTVSARGKGKEKAKIVYLSDDGEDDFIEDDVSEYEDFEGDDDNVRSALPGYWVSC